MTEPDKEGRLWCSVRERVQTESKGDGGPIRPQRGTPGGTIP